MNCFGSCNFCLNSEVEDLKVLTKSNVRTKDEKNRIQKN